MTGLDLLPWVSAPEVFPQPVSSDRGQDIPFSPAPFLFFAFRTCFQKCGGMDKTIGKHGDRSS